MFIHDQRTLEKQFGNRNIRILFRKCSKVYIRLKEYKLNQYAEIYWLSVKAIMFLVYFLYCKIHIASLSKVSRGANLHVWPFDAFDRRRNIIKQSTNILPFAFHVGFEMNLNNEKWLRFRT